MIGTLQHRLDWLSRRRIIQPRIVDYLMAQIDIAPTLLGVLHFSYRSCFFGYDILKLQPGRGAVQKG